MTKLSPEQIAKIEALTLSGPPEILGEFGPIRALLDHARALQAELDQRNAVLKWVESEIRETTEIVKRVAGRIT